MLRKFFSKLFHWAVGPDIELRANSKFVELGKQEDKRRNEARALEAEGMVGTPVIALTNANSDMVVGFVKEIEYVTLAKCPVPVILDSVSGKELLHFGAVFDYTPQRLHAFGKLTPDERWAIVMKHGYSQWRFKPNDEAPLLTHRELCGRLTDSGFFVKAKEFTDSLNMEKRQDTEHHTGADEAAEREGKSLPRPFLHPERQKGEVFLTNVHHASHRQEEVNYSSARLGELAYSPSGDLIDTSLGMKPLFVQIDEIKENFSPEKRIVLFGTDFEF